MPLAAFRVRIAAACCIALVPVCAQAEEGFDTEHIFGFMIGTDVGSPGERELQSDTTGRFGRNGGTYRALGQQVEIEIVPRPNVRIELGSAVTLHDIAGVPGIGDRRQGNFQGLSLDLRYRLLDREAAPFGLTIAAEGHADRIDETSGVKGRSYGTDFTVAFDREIVPNFVISALNLFYEPEWTRSGITDLSDRSSTIGAAIGGLVRVRPDVLIGGEMRYIRQYDGIGLGDLAGQALFVGPTVYVQLSERSRLTMGWSTQAWGRAGGSNANLDLVNFERHQARLVFGINF